MRIEVNILERHYNNIMAIDSMSLGRAPYKGIIMYAINAIKQGKVLEQEPTTENDLGVDCISRKAVLDLPKRTMKNYFGEVVGEVVYVKDIMDLPSVTPQTRWIPVSERLPDTNDEVLCWYEYYHWSQEKVLPEYGIGCYFKETSAWYGEVAVGRDIRVIAWTPLQPYKAESEYRK